VHDKQILALVLHGDFAVVLGENETASGEIVDAFAESLVSLGIHTLVSAKFRNDGVRYLLCINFIFFHPLRFCGRNPSNSWNREVTITVNWTLVIFINATWYRQKIT
jgi:hypothetical protein